MNSINIKIINKKSNIYQMATLFMGNLLKIQKVRCAGIKYLLILYLLFFLFKKKYLLTKMRFCGII